MNPFTIFTEFVDTELDQNFKFIFLVSHYFQVLKTYFEGGPFGNIFKKLNGPLANAIFRWQFNFGTAHILIRRRS